MAEWHETLIQGAFVFLVVSAMIADLSVLRVPNWIPVSLCAIFLVHGAMVAPWEVLGVHLLVGFGVLAGGFALFSRGVLGGGDAKFASALALWMGPVHLGAFLLFTALFGGVTALALIGLKKLVILIPALESRAAIARPAAWARAGKLPYAVPIGLAALILGPRLFA